MLLLLGNSRMASGDFNGAIQLFERAQDQSQYPSQCDTSSTLFVVSLVSDLMLTIILMY